MVFNCHSKKAKTDELKHDDLSQGICIARQDSPSTSMFIAVASRGFRASREADNVPRSVSRWLLGKSTSVQAAQVPHRRGKHSESAERKLKLRTHLTHENARSTFALTRTPVAVAGKNDHRTNSALALGLALRLAVHTHQARTQLTCSNTGPVQCSVLRL
jgi:hypothetical protein